MAQFVISEQKFDMPKEVILYGNKYEHDTINEGSTYYYNKDSVYEYEPIIKIFVNAKSVEEFKQEQIKIDSLINSFLDSESMYSPLAYVPESMYYKQFIDSLEIKYKQLDNFSSLSKAEICNLAQYSNTIDCYIFTKEFNRTPYANPKWIIPNLARDYKTKFDNLFNDYCQNNPQEYALERTRFLFNNTMRLVGDYGQNGFSTLINFYKTCPIKSEALKQSQVVILPPYNAKYCVITLYGLGTPSIIDWPKE